MKKLLFLPALFLFASCAFTDQPKQNPDLQRLREVTLPAFESLNEYQLDWNKANTNSILWIDIHGESQSKMQLKKFVDVECPKIKTGLKAMQADGLFDSGDSIPQLCAKMDKLCFSYTEMMNQLSSFDSYENPMIMLQMEEIIKDEDGDCRLDFQYIDSHLQQLKIKLEIGVERGLKAAH